MITTTDVLICTTTVLLCFYIWMKYHYLYWKRKNVPYIPPTLLIGNMADIVFFTKNVAHMLQDMYSNKISENEPIVGIYAFHKPALVIREPDLIKQILVKDFNKFNNRYATSDIHSDTLGGLNMFFVKNPFWKQIRTKLSPVFTTGRLRQMFPLMHDIGKNLDEYLCSLPLDAKTNSTELELKETCASYATDVIASLAYGVEANSLKNPDAEFRQNGYRIFQFTPFRAFEFTSMFFLPQIVRFCKFKVFSKESTKFIRDTINYVMAEREKSGAIRNDLIDALINLKKASQESTDENDIKLEGDSLVAQAAIFFTAGFEPSSATMSYGIYELCKKPKCQERLREEIRKTLEKNNGDIVYEDIDSMPYLHMVFLETLRMYPPLPFLDRECTLENGETEYSLKPYSDFAIPNGMPVFIPTYAIQRDPKYFKDPDEFDPERFSPKNKGNILPFTTLPFGGGPHNCIGGRFGLLQTKLGMVNFFKNHYVRPCAKTMKSMIFDKKAIIIQPKDGIYCEVLRDPLFK